MSFRERRFASQDGLDLYFRDYGDPLADATPVLCLGGLTRNAKDFHRLATRLSARRRVLCPDYRGRGRSAYDPNWRNYRAETYLADLGHLLAATNVHRTVVVGTSLGGLLAMGLAAARPTALAAVVLNDVGPEVAMDGLRPIVEYIRIDRPQASREAAVEALKALLPGVAFQDEGDWEAMVDNTYRADADGLLRFDWDVAIVRPLLARGAALPDMWPLFRALARIPLLAIRGERSDVLTPDCFDRMAAARPDLRRVVVPGVGHAPTLGEPECLAAIDAFLADL